MENLLKYACIAVAAVILSLTVKKYNPEAAYAITLAAGVLLITAAVLSFGAIKTELESLGKDFLPEGSAAILLRVAGIAMVTKLSGELCRDACENALAAKLELLGTLAAVTASIPLFQMLLRLVKNTV